MNDLIDWLCEFSFNNNVGFELKSMDKDMVSFAIPDINMVFININYHNQNEIPFQFAHEIGHVLDHDTGLNNFSAPSEYIGEEYQANLQAIHIIMKFCEDNNIKIDNYINFMNCFSIPKSLINVVELAFLQNNPL